MSYLNFIFKQEILNLIHKFKIQKKNKARINKKTNLRKNN